VKSVEELAAMREKASEGMFIRNSRHQGIRIVVSMGACGVDTGAREVVRAMVDELQRQKLEVQIIQTDCHGDCFQEPVFDVIVPGREKVTHVKMTPEQAVDVVRGLASDTL